MDHHGDIGLIHESDSTDKQRFLHIYLYLDSTRKDLREAALDLGCAR